MHDPITNPRGALRPDTLNTARALDVPAAVCFLLSIVNPTEPSGEWSPADLARALGGGIAIGVLPRVKDQLRHLRTLGYGGGRYVGGTSGHLHHLHPDVEEHLPLTCWGLYEYGLAFLQGLPDLGVGQTCTRKIESDTERVWLTRTGREDGEPWDNKVEVERFIGGQWITVERWQAR